MGSDPKSDPNFWGAEAPIHEVFISEYYIYILEVTNAQYAQCVAEQQCPRPEQIYSRTRREYYGNPRFDSYPVVYVTYQMAASYCIWAGGRLPSEAEWEKAARGTDGRLFPWGSELPNADLANYNETGVGDTMPVGSYPNGASAYGILDMGGNVLEWVYDLFDKAYYSYSQLDNPFGPAIGSRRVIRGGAWASGFDGLRTVGRASLHPEQSMENVGFRCVIETLP
jgi:formylglycine-generating enzyme required for sulfatase activity